MTTLPLFSPMTRRSFPSRSVVLTAATVALVTLGGCFGGGDESDSSSSSASPGLIASVCTTGTAEDFYYPSKSQIEGDWFVGGTPSSWLIFAGSSVEKIDLVPACGSGLQCDDIVVSQEGSWKIHNALLLLEFGGPAPGTVAGVPISTPDLLFLLQDCESGVLKVVEPTDEGDERKYLKD